MNSIKFNVFDFVMKMTKYTYNYPRFLPKIYVFWDETLCLWASVTRSLMWGYSSLTANPWSSKEHNASITQHNIPKNFNIQQKYCGNFKFRKW